MTILVRYRQTRNLSFGTALLLIACVLFASQPALAAERTKNIDLATAIIQVAKQTIPAVVHIEVTESQEVANPLLPFSDDPLFRRFFNVPQMPKKFKRETKGLGSGMIIDAQGHILTNHHVAGGATKIEVFLSSGERYPAERVGTDSKTDLAVIKISAKKQLPYVTFGDSDKVEVGEWVVAIGHPRGLDQTVTQGIISAKHRAGIADPGSYQDFLQTDAAINPGNSGGPLLNLAGEVIGVNAVIVSESGGFEGIGFTIPSNMAAHVARELITNGKVIRGWIGVTIQDLTPDAAATLHMEPMKGALVADVVKGGPAEKAGIRKNDVMIAYEGKEIADSGALRNMVAASPIDREATVTVLRGGKRMELTIKIENLEASVKVLAAALRERLGVEVRAVSPAEGKKFSLDNNQGVVVTRVDRNGAFGAAGFEVGDIILGIENHPIADVNGFIQLASVLKQNQKITVLGLDHRTGTMGNVEVTVK